MSYKSKYKGSEVEEILDMVADKQDKLIAGDNIEIEGNVISCTHDKTLYKIVSELPSEGDESKIYLIVSAEPEEQNIYTEYAWVNGAWEKLGTYRAELNLEPYLTKEEAETTYQPKGDYITSSDIPKEMIVMKAYLFDFSGTYTQAQVENAFKVSFDDLIAGIKAGNAIVITSSSDANGNYNIVFGVTYTLTDDKKLNTLSMLWWQYNQWCTLSLTYNSSSNNYTATISKTMM
jgi:hypothetical protein